MVSRPFFPPFPLAAWLLAALISPSIPRRLLCFLIACPALLLWTCSRVLSRSLRSHSPCAKDGLSLVGGASL